MRTRPATVDLFRGRHFDQEIIVLCGRWYLSFKLSSRDLVQMMSERGIALAHTTILRWVQCYVPEFEKRWSRYARPVNGSWRCDETYIKVKGHWTYLYRAVDKYGSNSGLPAERTAGCCRRQAVLHPGNPEQRHTTSDHSRRLRRFTSRNSGTEIHRTHVSPCAGSVQ
jgi:hypothetical protein